MSFSIRAILLLIFFASPHGPHLFLPGEQHLPGFFIIHFVILISLVLELIIGVLVGVVTLSIAPGLR